MNEISAIEGHEKEVFWNNIYGVISDITARKKAEEIKREREYLGNELSKFPVKVFPAKANFHLVKIQHDDLSATEVVNELMKKGIFVRDLSNHPLLENCFRTAVGTREMNSILIMKILIFLKTRWMPLLNTILKNVVFFILKKAMPYPQSTLRKVTCSLSILLNRCLRGTEGHQSIKILKKIWNTPRI